MKIEDSKNKMMNLSEVEINFYWKNQIYKMRLLSVSRQSLETWMLQGIHSSSLATFIICNLILYSLFEPNVEGTANIYR